MKIKTSKTTKILLFLTILGIFFRLYLFFEFNRGCCYSDQLTYHSIAKNIIKNGSFVYFKSDDRGLWKDVVYGAKPPLYPFFIALFYKLFGIQPNIIKLAQIFLSALTGILIYKISETIFSKKVALFSLIIFTFFWETAYMNLELMSENLHWFLLSLYIYLLLLVKKKNNYFPLFVGFVLGLLVLNRPTSLIYLLASIVWLFYQDLGRKMFPTFIIIFFTLILTLTPWTLRNYRIYKSFVFIYTDGGINFWMGNRLDGGGSYYVPNKDIVGEIPTLNSTGSMEEVERDTYYKKLALNYIVNYPVQAFDTSLRKIFRTFYIFRNDLINETHEVGKWFLRRPPDSLAISDFIELAVSYEYAFLQISFFLGLYIIFNKVKNNISISLLILLFLSNVVTIASSIWTPRYIMQMYPVMIPISAYLLVIVVNAIKTLIRSTK